MTKAALLRWDIQAFVFADAAPRNGCHWLAGFDFLGDQENAASFVSAPFGGLTAMPASGRRATPGSSSKALRRRRFILRCAPTRRPRDEIAPHQVRALNEHRRPRDPKVRPTNVKQLFELMREG
jgi:hypothetical protein